MSYRLIVSDLDGTLLNDRSEITPEVKKAVADAEACGTRFVIGSGRSYMSLQYFEKELGLHTPGHYGIGFNGGMVYETHSHKILLEYRLERGVAMSLIHTLRQMDAEILVYIGDELLAERESAEASAYSASARLPLMLVDSFDTIAEDVSKVMIKGSNASLYQICQEMRTSVEGRCNMFFSCSNLLEFSHLNAHKGAALEFLCRYLGVGREETIAVGDNLNDISMIEAAGLGVAVQNAVPEVKSAADVITDATNHEGAIVEVIRKYATR